MDAKEIKEKVKLGWIHLNIIQELAGFPEDFVIESMDKLNSRLGGMEGVKVIERKTHPTKEVSKGIWSTFAEIELLAKDFPTLMIILFDFMPSSVEIIAPEKISSDTLELSSSLNDLLGKLHHIDATAKKFIARSNGFERKLKEMGWSPEKDK